MAGQQRHPDEAPATSAEQALRRRAEARVRQELSELPDNGEFLSREAMQRLLHEVRVHQIELEMQNEELHRVQAELDASRAHYFELYDLAPVGYCTLSADGVILQANLTAATLLGMARGELVKQSFNQFIQQDDRDSYARHCKQLFTSAEPQVCDVRMVNGKGALSWAHLSLVRAQDADGKAVCRIVLSDITERKRAEEALREQNEFFQLISENIADFIAVLDLTGRRLYNSPSYLNFLGATTDLRGTDSFAEVHPDDRELVKRVFNETVQTGQGKQIDFRFVLADGSIRDMESRGSVIRDSAGRVARVVVVSHDITERKQMEAQVRQMAFHDALTQLPNRRLLGDRLQQTMAASTRSGCYAALMFLDLDNFKPLNDRHGHGAGDLLLVEAADRLKKSVREMDTVARFGGDEFVVMISELALDKAESTAQAGILAEKLRAVLSAPYRLRIKHSTQGEITVEHHCTASIGVALFNDHEASQEDVFRWADAAMYQAKDAGRNVVQFFVSGA
jgi:diguanylate cyclase (GGDEF)-like protein/PAS domain S-box-containing protein